MAAAGREGGAVRRLSSTSASALCRVAAVVGLLSLTLTVLPVLFPRPVPLLLGMSLGQGLGAIALLFYLAAILREMRRNAAARSEEGE